MNTSKVQRLVPMILTVAIGLTACGGAPTPAPTSAPVAPKPSATEAPKPAPPATTAPAQKPVSLRIAVAADESTLTPYTYVTGYPGWNSLSLVYDTLLMMNADQQPQPWLAKDMKISADGKTYTLVLRDGVKWHDGKPFTSADVKFSYDYFKKNTHPRWTGPTRNIASVDAPDEKTVVFNLTAPNASFAIQPLADNPIIPKHLWESVTDPKTFVNNVGTGPYKLEEYKADQFYRFKANNDFFAGKPKVDEIVMPIIKTPATIFASVKSGQVDATTVNVSPELVKDFESASDVKVQRGPGYASSLLQFNTERAPWDKKEVRQAVAMAIDRDKLINTVLLGYATAGNPGWIHPASPTHDPALKATMDVARAKSLLDGLGYKDTNNDGVREANGKPMEAALLANGNNPTQLRVAELIAAQLKEIGIALKVTPIEDTATKVWPEFDVAKGRDFDVSMWNWSAPVQINLTRLSSLLHSNVKVGSLNVGGFKNAEADGVADQLSAAASIEAQSGLARQLEKVIAEDVPFATLYYGDGVFVYRPSVFSDWVFQKGLGIFNKLSFVPMPK